jgi:hypothetical protein
MDTMEKKEYLAGKHCKHSILKKRKGDTPLGYSGKTALRREQCNVDSQSVAR